MREIKFRIWDGACGCMYRPDIKEHQNGVNIFLAGNFSYKGTYCGKECILMQYTGLKDKKRTKKYPKGQDIYEGDIVKDFICEGVYEVIFKEGCFFLNSFSNRFVSEKDNEVIGNIHENPELIKEK